MEQVLVSICIPTYNGERYLRECLDSCLHQSFGNYEVLVCDDGSSDGTAKTVEEYAGKHPRLRVLKNEKNLGLVGNWNKCLDEAKGEWIKFVFQDDYITSDCLEKFVKCIEPGTALIVSERNFILPENPSEDYINYYSRIVRTLRNTTDNKEAYYSPKLISQLAVKNLSMNFIGEPSLSFFRKDLVKEIGKFNDSLKQICDLEYLLRIASSRGLTYLPEKVCAFRIHKDSTTSTNVENKLFELKYIEPLLFSYFLLYGKHFESFRSHLSFLQMAKLKLYFKVKACKAYRVNLQQGQQYYLFNEANSGFKEILQNKNGNLVIKMLCHFT